MIFLYVYLISMIITMILGKLAKEPEIFWIGLIPVFNSVTVVMILILYPIASIMEDDSPINRWIKK